MGSLSRCLAAAALATALAPPLVPPIAAQTGNIPLSELGLGDYQGFTGGLYPDGTNDPPPDYAAAALAAAADIVPRNAEGMPDPEGRVVFVSIGMSNASQEFKAFERQADVFPRVNPSVVIVNAAEAEQSAEIIADPGAVYWSRLDDRVAAVASPEQVQACWIREQIGPVGEFVFPEHAATLAAYHGRIMNILTGRFPNLKLCYLSNATYGDYVVSPPEPTEPQYYESGFGQKWAIEDRIELFDQGLDDGMPFLLWGPDLWADGPTPRADGLTWLPADYEPDGQHPSRLGEAKVARQLATFLLAEPTAAWLTAPSPWLRTAVEAEADALVGDLRPDENFGALPLLGFTQGDLNAHSYVRFDLSGIGGRILFAKLSVGTARSLTTAALELVSDSGWDELAVTYNTAPPRDGVIFPGAAWSGNATMAYDVTEEVLADPDGLVTFALTPSLVDSGDAALSRDSPLAPRLVLTVDPGAVPAQ